ncbi:MAG TPA: replication-relaxation family protein [Ktedonobacteraceae bacterium]|nr:replication-relaxation family protein [Ktedonobacteraceae bacterium]
MSMLPPLSSAPLTSARLAALLASEAVTDPYPHLLRWLVWFPLLSASELTRLEQSRLARRAQTRSPQRVAALLQELEELGLIAHLVVNEPGWPPHQHRYFLTDAGLYVFAEANDPPLSVPKLVQAYAVERADLIERLSHIDIHLVLADFSSRLVAEGSTQGTPVTSFQQPWMQTDTIFGRRQRLRCDAAFLLADPQGTEHAFYVLVDMDERRPFDDKRERIPLLGLLNLRHAYRLQNETMPCLLIITKASRLTAWGTLLEKTSNQRNTALLHGAISTLELVQRTGVYSPVWWTFAELVHGMNRGPLTNLAAPSTSLSQLLGDPVSPFLAERFSQRRTFAHLVTERTPRPLQKTSRRLSPYVGKPLTGEIAILHTAELLDALSGTKAEQQEATALLNLALSAMQKDLLFWLTHHQLLTMHHLATLHHPGGQDIRGVQKQMGGLVSLHLLLPFTWYGTRPWHERERYLLAEPALRYIALREGRPPTYYLLPEEYKKERGAPALSIQRGTSGLFAQMEHTHGLYKSLTCLLEGAHHEKIRLITWKSAREALRWYRDPLTNTLMQIRPDAELMYLAEDQTMPHSVLVEYDRATTGVREYEAKYQSYIDYLDATHLALPPILVITQNEQAASLIRTCVDRLGTRLPLIIVLEDQMQRQGLLTLLTLLNRHE